MTREEAIARIKDHKIAHKMNEPRAIYISEALDMAIEALEQASTFDKRRSNSKMLIIEKCTDCPNFIRSTSPTDFTVKCKKIGNLGSPLNFLYMDYPLDCPLADAPQKDDVLDKIKAEIDSAHEGLDDYDPDSLTTFVCRIEDIFDKYKAESEGEK